MDACLTLSAAGMVTYVLQATLAARVHSMLRLAPARALRLACGALVVALLLAPIVLRFDPHRGSGSVGGVGATPHGEAAVPIHHTPSTALLAVPVPAALVAWIGRLAVTHSTVTRSHTVKRTPPAYTHRHYDSLQAPLPL